MDNNLKTEFKDFINNLSTEICKEVLLEELMDINNSFNETSNNFETLSNNYSANINSIKEQLTQLQTTNKKLDGFVTNIDTNNDKVNKALNVIDGSHKTVIDNIMADNKKLFIEYSKVVQTLNDNERKKFISELISSLDSHSKKHIADIKNVLDGSEIKGILNNISSMSNKMNSVEYQVKEMGRNLDNAEKKSTDDISKRIASSESIINSRINELNYTISNVTKEIDKKNNIIIALIVICIILIFFK